MNEEALFATEKSIEVAQAGDSGNLEYSENKRAEMLGGE